MTARRPRKPVTACNVQGPTPAGTYKVFWRDDDKKQRNRAFKTENDAERWASIVRAQGYAKALERLAETVEVIVTLDEVLEVHLQQLVSKAGTAVEYRKVAARSWGPVLGPLPVHAITRDDVTAWVKAQHAAGSAPKTIANAKGLLSAVLTTAVTRGHVPTNVARGVRMPTGERREKVYLSEAEFAALVAATPAWWRPFVVILGATGMRFNEAAGLQWRDIDWTASSLRVARTWHRVGGRYVLEAPKTRKSRRTIAIPPAALAELATVRARHPDAGPTDQVFVGEHGAVRVHPSRFREHVWLPARAKAKLTKDITPHGLRDSHVAWLVARGVPLPVIQARLGHESISTTIDVYGHLMPDLVSQSVTATGDVLGQLPALPAGDSADEEDEAAPLGEVEDDEPGE